MTYAIKDLNGSDMTGTFIKKEFQKKNLSEFENENVIEKKRWKALR